MRLLIDMNLTPRWVSFLQNAGYEAVHGQRSAPGLPRTAKSAITPANVLLTNDLDFPQILAHTKGAAPSVMLLRVSPWYQKHAVPHFWARSRTARSNSVWAPSLRSIGQTSSVQECCRSDRSRRVHLHLVLTELRTPLCDGRAGGHGGGRRGFGGLRDCQEMTTPALAAQVGQDCIPRPILIGLLQLGTRPKERRCNRRAGCNPAPLGAPSDSRRRLVLLRHRVHRVGAELGQGSGTGARRVRVRGVRAVAGFLQLRVGAGRTDQQYR